MPGAELAQVRYASHFVPRLRGVRAASSIAIRHYPILRAPGLCLDIRARPAVSSMELKRTLATHLRESPPLLIPPQGAMKINTDSNYPSRICLAIASTVTSRSGCMRHRAESGSLCQPLWTLRHTYTNCRRRGYIPYVSI